MDGTTITKADRAALENLWGKAGAWTADTWSELNAQCFAKKLRYRGIVWGLTPHGGRLGHTSSQGRITLHPALLHPAEAIDEDAKVWGRSVREMGTAFAADVLVHEMVHAWLVQTKRGDQRPTGSRYEPHNSWPWCEEIMRITPLLGLEPILAEPVKARRFPNPNRTGWQKREWSKAKGDLVDVWVPGDPKAPATIVQKAARDGYESQSEIASWPHCLRPGGYYSADGQMYVPV
jgi:hypothetical protein